jgi:hypothetical protein
MMMNFIFCGGVKELIVTVEISCFVCRQQCEGLKSSFTEKRIEGASHKSQLQYGMKKCKSLESSINLSN